MLPISDGHWPCGFSLDAHLCAMRIDAHIFAYTAINSHIWPYVDYADDAHPNLGMRIYMRISAYAHVADISA